MSGPYSEKYIFGQNSFLMWHPWLNIVFQMTVDPPEGPLLVVQFLETAEITGAQLLAPQALPF